MPGVRSLKGNRGFVQAAGHFWGVCNDARDAQTRRHTHQPRTAGTEDRETHAKPCRYAGASRPAHRHAREPSWRPIGWAPRGGPRSCAPDAAASCRAWTPPSRRRTARQAQRAPTRRINRIPQATQPPARASDKHHAVGGSSFVLISDNGGYVWTRIMPWGVYPAALWIWGH